MLGFSGGVMLSPLQEISSQDQSFTFQPNPSYVCPSSLRYDHIHALRQRLIPLSPEQRDKSGNQLRIWELKGSTFLGTVITPDGRMIILPQEKIINPMSQGSSAPALQRIREMQSFPFRLVYLENRQKMFIWPHMVAAGKDWVQPQFSEDRSTLGHIFRRETGHFLHDTPQNRAYILEAVSHPSNYGGKKRWGTELYFRIMPDGTQVWAEVKDGRIENGGINWIPQKWVEDISKRAGGELHTIQRLEYKPSTKGFTESLQTNKLTRTYNAVHRANPVEEHPSESVHLKDIGGVGNKSGLITDLFRELKGAEGEHFFITPSKGLCLAPLEIQTILRELAEGIFVHDAIPWFSLHYNHNLQLYPVIHPVYQNTVIGHVVSMLDYYMKGFAYGRCYPMDFVREWNDHPVMDAHRLKKESFDFQAYCERHLGERSFTFDEAVEQITKEEPLSSEDEKLVLLDGFQVEYRIVAKQNAINKSGPLLSIGGDFDVLYSIIGDPSSKAQKALYIRLEKACRMMCKQIKEKLPLIPMLSQELDALKLINFFVYYFNTLKEAGKVPVFDRGFSSTDLRCCPSLFPPLNTNRVHEVVLNLVDLWRCIPKDEFLRIMKSSDVRWGENCLVGILKRYFSSLSHSRNLSDGQIQGLAHALLPVCKGRYSTNYRAVNTVLSVIKKNATNLKENASFDVIIARIDELMKYAKSKEKRELLGDKKTLQKWFSDPVDFLFPNAIVVFNLTTKGP